MSLSHPLVRRREFPPASAADFSMQFGMSSTTNEVLTGRDLRGMRALVTGVTSGLGLETARALAAHGAAVIGTARDLIRAEKVLLPARCEAAAHGGSIQLLGVDLASLKSVRAAAAKLVARGKPLDLIVANAGVMATPYRLTVDGFETQLATNFIGHFVLVNRIALLLRDGARLVNIASSSHRLSDVDLDDPEFRLTPYEPYVAYGRSKTAEILFAVEFDRRYRPQGIRATAVHPGEILTGIGRHRSEEQIEALLSRISVDSAGEDEPPFRSKTVAQGAATGLWAGIVAEGDEIGGLYCENCRVTNFVTDAPLDANSEGVRSYALDADRASALWAKAEAWVGENFPDFHGELTMSRNPPLVASLP